MALIDNKIPEKYNSFQRINLRCELYAYMMLF